MGIFIKPDNLPEPEVGEGMFSRLASSSPQPKKEEKTYEVIPLGGIRYAVKMGYVRDGWRLEDYLAAAVYRRSRVKDFLFGKEPVEDDALKHTFECVAIWGQPGTGKSNLARQMLYRAVYHDWVKVVASTITSIQELLELSQKRQKGEDIPAVILDDISRTFSRQLYEENRELYRALAKALQVIRSIFPVILVTVPALEYMPPMLLPLITMEVHVTKDHKYVVNRIVPMVSFYDFTSFKHKVHIEARRLDLEFEPEWSYKMYARKRERLAWDAMDDLVKAMENTLQLRQLSEQKMAEKLDKLRDDGEASKPPAPPETLVLAMNCENCRRTWPYKPKKGIIAKQARCPFCGKVNKVPYMEQKVVKNAE
ncbi:MAG: hypothetical protein QXJ55_08160 [Candidatus Caldarchaeum sp.]